jgi:hypothetical protein
MANARAVRIVTIGSEWTPRRPHWTGAEMATMEGVQVVSLSLGYVMGQALRAAVQLGTPDALGDGALTVDEIAKAADAHAPSVARLMRTLAGGGIVRCDMHGRYRLTPIGQTLRRDHAESVAAAVEWVGDPIHYTPCGDLATSVRTGRPAFDDHFGQGYFAYLAGHPAAARVWDAGMACFSTLENTPIAQALQLPAGSRVVDVGGGQGGFLAALLGTDPTLRGVLFDRPEVVADPAHLDAAGLRERCELVGGDFFAAVPPGGDAYVLKRVLHDWDDEVCVSLLRRCRNAMAVGARLLVVDAVIPDGDEPHPATIVDLIMMGILRGRERTEAEFAALLAAGGLHLDAVLPTHSMLSILTATAG